jgi:hypothetical protein
MLFTSSFAFANENERILLPDKFKVYFKENVGVVNHPFEGSSERVLPTINKFKGVPGCYIACYSHNTKNSIYPVSSNIYVMGQIRVPGHYEGRICQPHGFENQDISSATAFKLKCSKNLPEACSQSSCWAGGDTGGWFGIIKRIELKLAQ